jgi:hypothetical protein
MRNAQIYGGVVVPGRPKQARGQLGNKVGLYGKRWANATNFIDFFPWQQLESRGFSRPNPQNSSSYCTLAQLLQQSAIGKKVRCLGVESVLSVVQARADTPGDPS